MARPQLHRRFAPSGRARLTVVTAPPGSGKTTLVREWLDELPAGTWAWVSLESADVAPADFWRTVADALRTVDPEIGVDLAERLRPQHADVGAVVDALADQLAERVADHPIVLVVDDLHRTTDPGLVDQLVRFVDRLEPGTHVVVTSRTDRGLHLARRRARGDVVEFRADDLRFTDDDAAELFDRLGLAALGEHAPALNRRTEGWAAGLSLAATALQRAGDGAAFLDAFGGWDRSIGEFLLDEVLATLPDDERAFLVETSILDVASPALCDAVTGRTDSVDVLRDLAERQLFVDRVDGPDEWYRYHHLFAEALRVELDGRGADEVARLHRRASEWCSANDHPALAVEYAHRIGDRRRVLDLILAHGVELFDRGELQVVRFGLDIADSELDSDDLAESIEHIEAFAYAGYPVPLLNRVERIDRRLRSEGASVDSALHGRFRAFHTLVAAFSGNLDEALELVALTEHHLGRFPMDDIGRRARYNVGRALRVAGRLDEARRMFHSLGTSGSRAISMAALGGLAETDLDCGDLRSARRRSDDALTQWEADGSPLTVAMSDAHRVRAALRAEIGDVDGAAASFEDALRMSAYTRHGVARMTTLIALAEFEARQGRPDDAAARLEDARTWWVDFPIGPDLMARFAEAEVTVALAAGDHDTARRAAADLDAVDRPAARNRTHVVAARLALATGDPAAALAALPSAAPTVPYEIELRLLTALAQHRAGAVGPARTSVASALGLGLPLGYRAVFVAEPELVGHLRDVHRGTPTSMLSDVLALATASVSPLAPAWTPEPLTERETEVLLLLPTHLTNPAIAAELYVSVNTVKGHVKSIYRKLRVTTRAEAVDRALEFGLLDRI